jgi:hypothetical protein
MEPSDSSFTESSHSYQARQPQNKKRHTANIHKILNFHSEMEVKEELQNAQIYDAEIIEPTVDKVAKVIKPGKF